MLGLVISDMLYRGFPNADEGELSRRLADLVRKETCAEVALTIELGAAIKLGSSEANAGARKRPAMLGRRLRGADRRGFLDGGYPAAERLVERQWHERMRQPRSRCAIRRPSCRNGRRRAACRRPVYREIERTGPDHSPQFRVAVELPHFAPAEGVRPLQARRRTGRGRRHDGARGRRRRAAMTEPSSPDGPRGAAPRAAASSR